jgi:hypothetical protein
MTSIERQKVSTLSRGVDSHSQKVRHLALLLNNLRLLQTRTQLNLRSPILLRKKKKKKKKKKARYAAALVPGTPNGVLAYVYKEFMRIYGRCDNDRSQRP